jgi:hypothetical protein
VAESLETPIAAANRIGSSFLLVSIPFFVLTGWSAGILGWDFSKRLDERNPIFWMLAAALYGFITGLQLWLLASFGLMAFS